MSGRMIQTAPPVKTRSVDPGSLNKFLDRSFSTGLASFGHNTRPARMQTAYDPALSWDGQSVHPQAFSRLDHDPRVSGIVQLSGVRVIETESALPGGLFQNVPKPGRGVAMLAPTVAQAAVDFDAGPEAPVKVAAREVGLTVTWQGERFRNMKVEPARAAVAPLPDDAREALEPVPGGVGALKKFLLTPAERQGLQDLELEAMAAKGAAKKAELQRRQLVGLLRDRHPQVRRPSAQTRPPSSSSHPSSCLRRLTPPPPIHAHTSLSTWKKYVFLPRLTLPITTKSLPRGGDHVRALTLSGCAAGGRRGQPLIISLRQPRREPCRG